MTDFMSQLFALIAAHAWAGVGGLFMATFIVLLTDRAKFFPTWDSPWRTVFGTLGGAIGALLDLPTHGGFTTAAVFSLVATVLPTLIAEIVAAVNGKAVAARASQRGFVRTKELMWMGGAGLVSWLVLAALLHGCAAVKGAACPIIHAIDEACPYIIMVMPDGTQKTFRREDVVSGAMKEAAARASLGDGGTKPAEVK